MLGQPSRQPILAPLVHPLPGLATRLFGADFVITSCVCVIGNYARSHLRRGDAFKKWRQKGRGPQVPSWKNRNDGTASGPTEPP